MRSPPTLTQCLDLNNDLGNDRPEVALSHCSSAFPFHFLACIISIELIAARAGESMTVRSRALPSARVLDN
mgnify:FL=1